MTNYVLGFVFSGDMVALIHKLRGPAPVIGKANGIGGHVDLKDASPHHAIAREVEEECGLVITPDRWISMGILLVKAYDAKIHMFKTNLPYIRQLIQKTDERVDWYFCDRLPFNVVPNLRWMIPLARDTNQLHSVITDTTPGS